MSPILRVLVAAMPLFAACGHVPAQWVWPGVFAGARGNAVMNAPFSLGSGHAHGSTRCTVVIDSASLPFAANTVIHRISLRRDTSYANQAYGSVSGTLQVRIGHAAAPPDAMNHVRFADVFAGSSILAYYSGPQTPFVLPAASAPGTTVPPFSVVIPFTNTFRYIGGPIAIEFLWTPAPGTSTWRVDSFALPRPHGVSRTVAAGCTGSNGFEPTHFVLPETTNPGATLTVQLEGARRPTTTLEMIAIHALGLQNNGPALPLPLAAFGGVPGCYLRIDPVMSLAVAVDNPSLLFTRARSAIALPPQQALVGAVVYSQWICFDTAFNTPLPLTASDVQAITLGPIATPPAPRTARTLWKYGATGYGDESGRMVPDDYGPVLRFN